MRAMAVIVTHKQSGGRFVVLGANASKWATSRGDWLFGNLAPVEKEGTLRVVVIAGADGVIQFANGDELRVLEADGQPLAALLGSA
jgi:hypothetical protein